MVAHAERSGRSARYLHNDHRGTTYKITDDTGAEVWSGLADAYGVELGETGTPDQSIFWYQGQAWYRHVVGGQVLYVSPTRIYMPEDGRFIERDLISDATSIQRADASRATHGRLTRVWDVQRQVHLPQHVPASYTYPVPPRHVDPVGTWWPWHHRGQTGAALDFVGKDLGSEGMSKGQAECIEDANSYTDWHFFDDFEYHAMGSLAAYKELRTKLMASIKLIAATDDKPGCTKMAEELGALFHMTQDVNSHRGINAYTHEYYKVDNEGSPSEVLRKAAALAASKTLAKELVVELTWYRENCLTCHIKLPSGYLSFARTLIRYALKSLSAGHRPLVENSAGHVGHRRVPCVQGCHEDIRGECANAGEGC